MTFAIARTMDDAQDEAQSQAVATGMRQRVRLCRLCGDARAHFVIKPVDRIPAAVYA